MAENHEHHEHHHAPQKSKYEEALNWKQYQRENIVNIYVMSGAIIIFLITLFLRK